MKLFPNIFEKKTDLLFKSITFSLNLLLPTLIIILISFTQKYILVAELSIVVGFNIILTQIFSANSRSLIIKNESRKLTYAVFLFRLLLILIILAVNYYFLQILKNDHTLQLFLFSFIILQQWLVEIILTYYEISKKRIIFVLYNFVSFLFILLMIFSLFFDFKIIYSLMIFNFFLFILILNFLIKIEYKNDIDMFYLKNFIFEIFKSNQFYSSFFLSFANLIWRLLIIYFCGKVIAGIYFAGFAIGSLPGTLFNNTFGPKMAKDNIKFNKYWFLLFNLICFISILSSIFIFFLYDFFASNLKMQSLCSLISIGGSYFMLNAMMNRQYVIQNTNHKDIAFKYDIISSILILFIIPLLFLLGGTKLIIGSFFVSSITSAVVYKILYKKIIKNELD